jgi:hypothetical protein
MHCTRQRTKLLLLLLLAVRTFCNSLIGVLGMKCGLGMGLKCGLPAATWACS